MIHDDYSDWDAAELRAEVRYQNRQHQAFLAAPDCRDPDHPGCPACMGNDDDQDGAA